MNSGFPVFSVKWFDFDTFYCCLIETSYIHADSVRVGAGNIKRFNPAGPAKQVFGFMGIKGIGLQVVLT
jgi:hypothetical protein